MDTDLWVCILVFISVNNEKAPALTQEPLAIDCQ